MDVPAVRYAYTSDDVRIAYQDFGDGPPGLVCNEPFTHLEGSWTVGPVRRLFERLAHSGRVLVFDHRGSGMSDGFETPPSLEDRILDIEAVLDAAGVETTSLYGSGVGGQVAIGFAAWRSERVHRLLLMHSRVGASGEARAEELNPGIEVDPSTSAAARLEQARTVIGVESAETRYSGNSPSAAGHPGYLESLVAYERLVGSRDVWRKQIESIADIDIVEIAPLVRAETLITSNHNRVHHLGWARLLHELIPNSTLIEFEGEDVEWWLGDNWTEIADTHIEFLTGKPPQHPATSRFGVVMFTDLVASTSSASALGDTAWKQRLDSYEQAAVDIITDHGGQIIKQTGDGHLALFDHPDRAVRAALQLSTRMEAFGTPLRIGLHGGMVEQRGDDISGTTVNIASRVENASAANEVYVTSTIREMLLGSRYEFDAAGTHSLPGFEEPWSLYRAKSRP